MRNRHAPQREIEPIDMADVAVVGEVHAPSLAELAERAAAAGQLQEAMAEFEDVQRRLSALEAEAQARQRA